MLNKKQTAQVSDTTMFNQRTNAGNQKNHTSQNHTSEIKTMLTNYFKIAIAVLKRRKFFTFISLFGISFTLTILIVLTAFVDNLTALPILKSTGTARYTFLLYNRETRSIKGR